ncbi:LIM domain-containing protein WLIM2b-like isoform X1 [Lycium ferocissimum]|uniref:LIM domain-containing protein WLIM2b-like isoform X1 n=1 Tax=Lycium ferocissimum TaxID=112874 RepID=UPI0028155FB3|nr:LIM domain-containing protein WLIM2b-like isoform X1 [Lycium ferocissimum]
MAFTGNQQKCKACEKTVYIAEMISTNGVAYHNTCFRCKHCNGRLALSTYSTLDGVLYCKPHFEQIYKEKGGAPLKHSASSGKQNELNRSPSKVSALFSGTQDKCAACKKTVYPLEKVTVDGEMYHNLCFRCVHGGCKLTTSSYAAFDGRLYCKPHFSQLFKEKGSYNHLSKTTSMKKSSEGQSNEQESSNSNAEESIKPKETQDDQGSS